ncbi:MAG TPA: sugar ABC transporter permease [Acidimicrobiia bacterium]|nr:sugar ABC transporter permease [Acidimicrobiia bacterium]
MNRKGIEVLRALLIVGVVAAVLWYGYGLLTQPDLFAGLSPTVSKLLQALIAIVIGVIGIWALFYAGNTIIEALPGKATDVLRPYLFVVPALLVVGIYLIYPAVGTVAQSFTDVPEGEGALYNYSQAFTDPEMLIIFRNNVMWLLIVPIVSVVVGLVFAGLVDRIKLESLAKSFVFLPLAISFVGAAVIWQFVYAWKPAGQPQIGILNSFWVWAGGFLVDWGIISEVEPIPWLFETPINNFALMVIMIWLQVGFAMVVLSAAIKGVPTELTEAARIDGATERQIFYRITIPSIKGALLVVYTTIAIAVLKVFDLIFVTTGGNLDTSVIAVEMYQQMFRFRNLGFAATLAVILLVAVIPIMVVNLRNLRRQGIGA